MWQHLTRTYFNTVYNPLYDLTTARLSRYVAAQKGLAESLSVEGRQRVLCVGLGTGNELTTLRERAPDLDIVGVDVSPAALTRARSKPAGDGQGTAFALMDAQQLAFRGASFDRLLCYHVTDFIPDPATATAEMLRVLRPGGRFVISFPSGEEGFGLGVGLARQGLTGGAETKRGARVRRAGAFILAALVYTPLLLRPRPRAYSPGELDELLLPLGARKCRVENDPVYRDHVVSGIKTQGGEFD